MLEDLNELALLVVELLGIMIAFGFFVEGFPVLAVEEFRAIRDTPVVGGFFHRFQFLLRLGIGVLNDPPQLVEN